MARTTPAERQRLFKAKHKGEDKYIAQRKAINNKYHLKFLKNESPAAAALRRTKDAARKRLKRQADQEKNKSGQLLCEKKKVSPSALGKAFKKANSAMPKSPTKQREVLKKLLKEYRGNAEIDSIPRNELKKNPGLNDDVIAQVSAFYEEDDISRIDPGMKTARVRRTKTNDAFKARRYLRYTITEAYGLFRDKFPDTKIGRSKFAQLRPSHVRPFKDIPHNVCVCRYCENFESLREVISKHAHGFGVSSLEFVRSIVCNVDSGNCINYRCTDCLDKFKNVLSQEVVNVLVQYKQWKLDDKRFEHVLVEEELSAAIEELNAQLPNFLLHSFNQRQSQKYFTLTREKASRTSVVMQIDFAENYSCVYQDEIQSAHWSNPQVAIFTAVLWYGPSDCDSYAVVSDVITHDRYCVATFLETILDDHLLKNPDMKELNVFSDGAASQFKQKYNFSNVTFIKEKYSIDNLKWTFFATSHGKGAVDGIGAVVKRCVWNKVRSQKTIVRNAETFVAACNVVKTSVIYVKASTIEESKQGLDTQWEKVLSIKGTQKLHHFAALSPYIISYKMSAFNTQSFDVSLHPDYDVFEIEPNNANEDSEAEESVHEISEDSSNPNSTCKPVVNQYVAVIWDDQWLPGIIEEVFPDGRIKVKSMKCVGENRFQWPDKDDIEIIAHNSVLATIMSVPVLVSFSRHALYSLPTKEYNRVLNLYVSTL